VTIPIQVGPATVTINRDDRVLVCQPNARIAGGSEDGFFARDTRFVSGYDLLVNGSQPILLNSSQVQFFSARFEFCNDALIDEEGPIERHTISVRLDRTIAGGVHEDYDITNYGRRTVHLAIEMQIASDFADLFDVKDGRRVHRGSLHSRWYRSRAELRTRYENRDFHRELIVAADRSDSPAQFANGRLVFAAHIPPKDVWHTCLRWLPLTRPGRRPTTLACNAIATAPIEARSVRLPTVSISTPNVGVNRAWDQAIRDLKALRIEDPTFERGVFIPAAGVPWFMTLFGRDSLIVSMQTISGFPEFAAGALRRLSNLQATADDPERDMEPGKIPHEVRHGELAQLGILPFQPYYGTHDATSLFIIVLSCLYHWLGDKAVLRRYLPNAEAAMAWIDHAGDRDGDGFQEYATRSSHGYYNQGWKDAGDAIQHHDGTIAPLPLAVCELQGYAYDAKVRLASIYDVLGRPEEGERVRQEARQLYERFNDRFWWEAEGTYYTGLDGRKQPIRSVTSNAGHLLSSGIVPTDRAARVARRLMADDMWSGWGIRTLSSDHPGYNPFSYHTGSVWPHDNAIIAGGFRTHGLHAETARIARGMFDAAERFQANRLPELFAGLPRDEGSFPVQYLGANVPQAWASGAVIRFIAILCGIDARSDHGGSKLYVDPALPDWLPDLTISNLRAGRGSMTIHFRDGRVEVLSNTSGYEVVRGVAPHGLPGGGAAADVGGHVGGSGDG